MHCLIRGRVQGIGFRWYARSKAAELELAGWCANLLDGRVEVWAQGNDARVEAMVQWLHRGPPAARVDEVIVERGPGSEFSAPPHARIPF